MIIEIESIYKSNYNAKLNGLGPENKWSNKSEGKRKRFSGSYIVKVEKLS